MGILCSDRVSGQVGFSPNSSQQICITARVPATYALNNLGSANQVSIDFYGQAISGSTVLDGSLVDAGVLNSSYWQTPFGATSVTTTTLATSAGPNPSTAGNPFQINGDDAALFSGGAYSGIVVNSDLVIDNATFEMGYRYFVQPGKKIIVPGNTEVILDNVVNFQACTGRWEGFDVQTKGKISTTPGNARGRILDAVNGINLNLGSTADVEKLDFGSNLTGIRSNNAIVYTNDCAFYRDDARSGQAAVTGIDVSDNVSTVVQSSQFFDLSDVGIEGENSDVGSYLSTYHNIGSHGIRLSSSKAHKLECLGIGKLPNEPSFLSIPTGIELENMSASIFENTMTNVETGIYSHDSPVVALEITDNIINASEYGVRLIENYIYRPTGGGFQSRISKNDINIDGGVAYGVYAESGYSGVQWMTIRENVFEITSGNAAIDYSGGSIVQFDENDISFNGPYGINITAVRQAQITQNAVYGSGLNETTVCIRVDESPFSSLVDNCVDKSGLGLQFLGELNSEDRVRCNDIGADLTNGLVYGFGFGSSTGNGTGNLGKQNHQGNKWGLQEYPGLNNAGAIHHGIETEVQNSTLIARQVGKLYSDELIPLVQPDPAMPSPITFFKFDLGTEPNCRSCGVQTEFVEEDEELEFFTTIDEGVANGGLDFEAYGPMKVWRMKRNLYSKMLRNPQLDGGQAMQSFFNAESNTSVGAFEQWNVDLAGAMSIPGNQMDWIKAQEDSLAIHRNSLVTALELGGSTASIEQEIQSIQESLDSFFLNYQQELSAQVVTLSTENAAITTEAIFEENQKIVNQAILDRLAGETLTNEDALIAVAYQCRDTGGPAVIQARGMLNLAEEPNDLVLCEPLEGRSAEASPLNLGLKVSPNPVQDVLRVELPFMQTGWNEVTVFSSEGRVVYLEQNIGQQTHLDLDVTPLSSGVYYLQLTGSDQTLQSKFVKQ